MISIQRERTGHRIETIFFLTDTFFFPQPFLIAYEFFLSKFQQIAKVHCGIGRSVLQWQCGNLLVKRFEEKEGVIIGPTTTAQAFLRVLSSDLPVIHCPLPDGPLI